jgi:hypothetical protein
MHQVTVRRWQADQARSTSDFVDAAQDILRMAQAERGKGVWSDTDPEVWIGAAFVGRLRRGGDIAQLAQLAMDDLDVSIKRQATS